jgi:hypothetical protein
MRRFSVVTAVLLMTGAARGQDKFIDLTWLLPPSANAAAVIDVQAIYNSPLAQQENWSVKRPLPIPPTLLTVALATRIDPGALAGGKWEVGVGAPVGRLTMDQLAAREKGALENIAGAQAVLSPRNVYFVEIRPWIIGMISPADRQEVAKWVKEIRNLPPRVVRLDPYLKAAVTSGDRLTQFILAIDLSDSVNPADVDKEIQATLATIKMAGPMPPAGETARVLGTVQGVKFTAMVTDAIHGELRFTFGEPTAAYLPWAKPLLVKYFSGHGATLEALADWTAEADGKDIVFRGQLREQGYRRILSLVAPPAPPGQGQDKPLDAEIRALATQRYYQTIAAYLDDLQKPTKAATEDNSKYATWYDSFAQKIEQMPTYAVDEDVAKFGRTTAARLRGIASSLRGELVDVQKLEQSISFTPYIYGTSGWGGWGRRRLQPSVFLESNEGQVRTQQQATMERSTQVRQDLWSRIENDSAQIAQALAARYKAPGK